MKSIQERLAALADRFLDQAEKATNPKTALSSLGVVEKSIDLLDKFRLVAGPESVLAFVSVLNLDYAYSKPELWRAYLEFCDKAGFDVESRKEFNSALLKAGFTEERSSGVDKVFPPRNRSKLIDGAEKLYDLVDVSLPVLTTYSARKRTRSTSNRS